LIDSACIQKKGDKMNNRRRLRTVLLSLTVLISLTLGCSLPGLPSGSDVVPDEEEIPTAQLPAEETAEPPSQELPFEMDEAALDNLNSYAYAFRLNGLSTMQGGVENFELSIEGKRQNSPQRAEQLKFHSSSDGDTQDVEAVYGEDLGKMWMREGTDAWQEIPVMDQSMLQMFDALSMRFWWDSVFAGDPEGAQYVGDETVNGVASHHYRNTESSFIGAVAAGCTFASVQDDIWVAVDGSFPVKRELNTEATCGDTSGTFNLFMEIRDVNQPQEINPPM
jgi:hypothetical protein